MLRAFRESVDYNVASYCDEFQSDIPIKLEVIVETPPLFEEDGTPRTADITKDDREYSQWYARITMRLSNPEKSI